jgi:hypothetical protein
MLKVVSLVPLGSAAREEIESIHPSIELHMATVETKRRLVPLSRMRPRGW